MENKYKDNPIMIVAVLIAFTSCGALAYTNWGNEMTRSIVAVFALFWSISVGYFIRDGIV